MATNRSIPAGHAFFGPRGRENAQKLLDAAKELGLPANVVRTQQDGFIAPQAVVDAATGGGEDADETTGESTETGGESTGTEGKTEDGEPDAPAKNASQEAWLTYAKSKGYDGPDDVTRADLISKYGKDE